MNELNDEDRPVGVAPWVVATACAISRYSACYAVVDEVLAALVDRYGDPYHLPTPVYDPHEDRVCYGVSFTHHGVDVGFDLDFYKHKIVIETWSHTRRLTLEIQGPPRPHVLQEELGVAISLGAL